MSAPAPPPRPGAHAQSGQAAVESALTLPLGVFLFLGTLQLFLLMQGRILAQYALSRAPLEHHHGHLARCVGALQEHLEGVAVAREGGGAPPGWR